MSFLIIKDIELINGKPNGCNIWKPRNKLLMILDILKIENECDRCLRYCDIDITTLTPRQWHMSCLLLIMEGAQGLLEIIY